MAGETKGIPNDQAAQIRLFLEKKEFQSALSAIRQGWLSGSLQEDKAADLLAQVMSLRDEDLLAERFLRLASEHTSLKADAQFLFELGFELIEKREHALAAHLLKRSQECYPEEPLVNYELGFALMSLHKFAEAIPCFETALRNHADFDTTLNLAACYLLTRQLEKGKNALSQLGELASTFEEVEELNRQKVIFRRLETVNHKDHLTVRDWLFVQYGAILLRQAPEHKGGLFGTHFADYNDIAIALLCLRGILDGLGTGFEMVEYYSRLSRPMAECLGHVLGLPVVSYKGPQIAHPTLLTMAWANDIIGPHKAFVEHHPFRDLFSYSLGVAEMLPLTPEIVGLAAQSALLPWDASWIDHLDDSARPARRAQKQPLEEDALVISEKILLQVNSLESSPDLIKTIAEAVSYYQGKKELLTFNNAEKFPRRSEFTAEIPL